MKITIKVCGLAASIGSFAVSGIAFAQTSSPESIGTITSAADNGTDKSMSLLQLVYGSIVSNPLSGGSGSGAGGMISQVFVVLNACILAVGVVWAIYLFLVALIATGQEGKFLGEKRSSAAWMIRVGMGFTGLVPMFGGYSGAQVIMLYGTKLGVGIANLTLSAAISVLASGGTMVATPVAPQVTTLARSLFEANLCAQAANKAIANLPNDAGVSADAGETFSPLTATGKVVLMNQNGLSCGGAEINANSASSTTSNAAAATTDLVAYAPDTSSMTSSLQAAQQSALTAMQSTLSSAAQAYVLAVNGGQQPTDPQTTINQAAQTYQNSIQAAISSASSAISGLTNMIQSNLTRDGWIMLGAWYQSFAQANSQLSNMAATVATAVPATDLSNLPYPQLYQSVMAEYNEQVVQDASTSTPSSSTSSGASTSAPVNNLFTGTTDPQGILSHYFNGQGLVNEAISVTSGSGSSGTATGVNPLIGMKNMGDYILESGWGMLGAYVGWSALSEASQSAIGSVIKGVANAATFGAAGAAQGAANGAVKALAPFIVMMVIALFFFGAMLSVYLPMLPFIIWFGGIMSWFAVVAEAMVASPLWAFAHLDGEGEGLGQRTQHGYIFLLNVMFRPVFMVLGFLLAGVGIVVLGTLLNTMFGVAMQNAQYNSQTGLVSIIAFIVLYVGMCQTLCNSMFSLIHVIPDQVFSWVGGQMAGRIGHDMADKSGTHLGGTKQQAAQSAMPMARGGGQPATAASPGTASANPVLPPGN
ncbi:DotA/TraY family protein [Paraburkholderia fungorum]|uniref:DotA/TraY family protein n=1 Tax=Paraburkholderia fungorum TaxID=134537 RepID=UPI0038BC4FCC